MNKAAITNTLLLMGAVVTFFVSSAGFGDNRNPLKIKEEKTSVNDTTFITPNEFQTDAYSHLLANKKGAYIGVGALRIFNTSQFGDFQKIIGLDYASPIRNFNHEIIQILTNTEGHRVALAELLELNIGHYFEGNKKLTDGKFYQWLFSQADLSVEDIDGREGLPRAISDWKDEHSRQWSNTIFGSAEKYKKARGRAKDGTYISLTGNLIGNTTLFSLSEFLKSSRIPVSVIDLSNSLDYFETKAQFRKLIANLQLLPLSKDAAILFTTSYEIFDWLYGQSYNKDFGDIKEDIEKTFAKSKDNFIYLSMPVPEFIKFIKQANSRKSYLQGLFQKVVLDYKNIQIHHPKISRAKCSSRLKNLAN